MARTPARWAVRRPFALGTAGGLAFGALMALAFAPVGFWPAAFLAAGPLVAVGELVGRRRNGGLVRAAVGAWVGVMPWWAYAMVWTARNTQAGYPPLIVVLSVYAGVFVWAYARTRRRVRDLPAVALVPVLWAGVEVVRGEWGFDGYPWYLVAHPLIDGPGWWFTWPAAVGGAYLVSGLAVLPIAAAADWFVGRRRWALRGLGVAAAWVGLGALGVMRPDAAGSVRTAVVQTNVPQDVRGGWDPAERWRLWGTLDRLTREAASGDAPPAMIVWPETMFPGAVFEAEGAAAEETAGVAWFIERPGASGPLTIPAWAVRELTLELQGELGVPLIVGAASYDGFRIVDDERGLRYAWDARRNSVFLADRGRVVGEPYSKLRLVPFGEVMPYISAWPWLEERLLSIGASGMSFDLVAGDRPVRLEVPSGDGSVRLATPICFEITVSGVVRRLVYEQGERAADALVVLTNDGWFGDWDAGRVHHLQAARWRCVELGIGMARSANTGVSAIVDAEGRVLDATAPRVDGVLAGEVPMYAGGTVFGSTVGLWPAWAAGAAAVVACVAPWRGRPRRRAGETKRGRA